MTKMDYETYGIDLATTFSGIARVQRGLGDSSKPEIVINEKGIMETIKSTKDSTPMFKMDSKPFIKMATPTTSITSRPK